MLKYNRDGAFATQSARKSILLQAAEDLVAGGFKLSHVQGLKQKHIYYLNDSWKQQSLANAIIKNRNAHLRWLCEKIGKKNLAPSNDTLRIGKRCYVNNSDNKAVHLKHINLTKITNPYVRVQIHLQYYLGLRREESIKLKPHQADQGDHLALQASWCEGGRARTVPILAPEARYWLDAAKQLAATPEQALISAGKTYIQQRYLYDKKTRLAGIRHAHGLRHAYAQARYKTLTGWDCPKCGGLTSRQLTAEQKALDKQARLIVSQELGHGKEQVTVSYLGR